MKKIICFGLALALLCATALSLASCQLSRLGKDTTAPDTTVPDTTSGETPVDPYPAMDMMHIDLTPYITLASYKGLTIKGSSPEYTDEEFEAAVNEFLEYYADYEQVTDRVTAEGDVLCIDFEGYIDGVQFEGGTAAGQYITLSEETGYIEGFDKDLYGIMPGTTVESSMVFPEDYNEQFAGKAVTFKIKVNYIIGEDLILPELTDAFVKEESEGEYETVEAFLTDLRKVREEEKRQTANAENSQALFAKIVADSTIHKIPEEQFDYYYKSNVSYYTAMAENYGTTYEGYLATIGTTDEALRENAETYVREDLVFYSIVKAEGLAVSDEEYVAGRERYAEAYEEIFYYYGYDSQYKDTYEWLDRYYGEEVIRQNLLWDEVFEALLSWSTIEATE